MRAIAILVGAGLCVAASGAAAQESEPYFTAFDVAQSAPPRSREITRFEIAGEEIALRAYGRKSRARMFDATKELKEARAMGQVFDDAPQPPLVTIEAQIRF